MVSAPRPMGLVFGPEAPATVSAPNRADVACFVGFVARRESAPVPPFLRQWLAEQGWAAPAGGTAGPYARPEAQVESLLDLPVLLESWDDFDRLFAWEGRSVSGDGQHMAAYLGAAVRSFFAQGGRKCYVVRVGDPWEYAAPREQRTGSLSSLVPGFPHLLEGSPVDRSTWRGVAHLFGLPDVSFLCLPDLADAVRVEEVEPRPAVAVPPPPEQFVECSEDELPPPPPDDSARLLPAPRCDGQGYADWARVVRFLGDFLYRPRPGSYHLREMQLVASVPLPYVAPSYGTEGESGGGPWRHLAGGEDPPLARNLPASLTGLSSAFVQLVYPWVRTPGSSRLPESLESPDGVVTGLLARNALTRNTYRSAAGLPLGDVYDLHPVLGRGQLMRPVPEGPGEAGASHILQERVTLLGRTPGGLALLSDVTTSLADSYRPASVNRLVASVLRAARRVGEDSVFEVSGQRVWGRLRERLEGLLQGLYRDGALRGEAPAEAFTVRCDRTTMTQNDIDSGRVIVHVTLDPAVPVDTIVVVLSLDSAGTASPTVAA